MKGKKRISMLLVVILLVFMIWFAMEDSINNSAVDERVFKEDITLEVWYSEAELQNYIEKAAESFEAANHVTVNTRLMSEVDYIENINNQSVGEEFEGPDVYLVSNDQLEMVELAGLTKPVNDTKNHYTTEYFCDTALHAVRYNGAQIAYPISFETSFLIYNKDYITIDQQAESESSEETQTEKMEVIPTTLDELMEFSENFEEKEGVENIFRFDVSDIFYTYFFVGDYLKLGGLDGDNAGVVNIANDNVKSCLVRFQELAQFFAIDIKTINYDTVLKEFAEGKTVYAIGKTDAVQRINDLAQMNGKEINYGIAVLPNVSADLNSKALSVTTAAVVNGYTRQEEEAARFADYLSFGYAGQLYECSGKYTAKRYKGTGNGAFYDDIYKQYENSVSLPKLLNASNFWVNLEIAFFNIWNGENVDSQIQSVSDQVTKQLNN